ncbi:PREDICTED: PWWP domain-containing protein MUM1-like [Phaethon lepturus]|uniref:PWWP domain-containing protein MUM1-like n=1 Tax=Phaethon lepturus TaxID=97097 RepID=UPI0005304779|nr:PREDICTED: PWWP domain-containing protein MUM1-like [Phaethon lepturus]
MTDQEYVLCTWKKRLWPAKVLCKTGVLRKTSGAKATEASFKVEILGLKEQVCVNCADAVPLKEECIENIASNLDQGRNLSEAVEELKYRRSLKIALDVLNQNASPRQVPPSGRGPTQPCVEEGSPVPAPCESDTAAPVRRANTGSQPRRTLLDSSCKSTLDDLEKSISSKSESLAKQLDGRKKPVSLKQINGEQETGATASSYRKRKCRNRPESASGLSNHGMLSDSFPSQCKEEENKNTSHVVTNKVKQFQLPDFEEDEGLESSDLSSNMVSSESLSRLSPLVDEEEEDEELPSILSHQEPQSIEEGILVWCKLRRYPYWPAVVKNVKRKHRKACVLLIEGNTNDKKKGFSVSLKNLKHFDCEEKQDLIERAKEDYRQEIEWCIRLISDYRIRVGCHSFTGSFLEYFAADISYPVRKEGYQGLVQMTFLNTAEEDPEESPSETSPQKPSKKLLPDRTRAARDKANKKIVEFIVKTKGAEEHLLAILKSRKQSRWLKEFLNSSQYVTCVETYLEDEEQLDLVVNYLKEVYREIDTKNLHQINGDGIKFISDVLLPEAIIYAISAVDDIDYKKAEEKYIKGPSVSKREREIFDEEIIERKKCKTKLASAVGV